MEEYSPFKDYLNLCSIFGQDTVLKQDKTAEIIEKFDHDIENWIDSICPDSIEDLLSSSPPSPDSSADDADPDVFETNMQENEESVVSLQFYGIDHKSFRRMDSLSSSQHSSSSDESLAEDLSCDSCPNDFMLSAFLGQLNFAENVMPSTLQYQLVPAKPTVEEKYCILCKRNGETREYYTTHVLKDNRGKVICPVLRKYVCPKCKATGDNAHTLRHCPLSDTQGSSTTETCYTLRSSCGRRRKRLV